MKQNTKKILFFACIFILFFMAFQKNNLYEGNRRKKRKRARKRARKRERRMRRKAKMTPQHPPPPPPPSPPPNFMQMTNVQSNQSQQVSMGATHTGSY